MNKIQKFNFNINFNSYFPHAYVFQNGNFLKFISNPKKENITNNIIISNKKNNYSFKININKLQTVKKELTTSASYISKRNYLELNNINSKLKIIVDDLKKEGLTEEEILKYVKSILYKESEIYKQKTKTI